MWASETWTNSLMVYSFGDMAPSPESCRPVMLTGGGFTQTKTPRSKALFVRQLPLCLEEILWDLNWGLLVPYWASQVALVGKNPPVNGKDIRDTTWVSSLGWEDPMEEGMEPTAVFLPGKSHGQRSHSPRGCKESDTTETTLHTHGPSFLLTSLSPWLSKRSQFLPAEP